MDRNVNLSLNVRSNLGSVARDLEYMAASSGTLSEAEEKYQKQLQATVGRLETRRRLEADLVALGLRPGQASAEEAHQSRLDREVKRLEEVKRLNEDLIARGLKEAPKAPLTQEQREQAYIDRANERKRFRAAAARGEGEQSASDYLGARYGPLGRAAGGVADEMGIGGGTVATLGKLGLAAGLTVGALHLLEGGLKTATPIINTLADVSLTAAQKQRRILEELPVVGGLARAFHDLADAATGATESMRRVHAELATTSAVQGAENQGRSRVAGLYDQQSGREARAEVMRGLADSVPDLHTTREVGPDGDRKRAEQQRMYALEGAERKAQAEVDVAREEARIAAERARMVRGQSYITGADEAGNVRRRTPGALLESERRGAGRQADRALRGADRADAGTFDVSERHREATDAAGRGLALTNAMRDRALDQEKALTREAETKVTLAQKEQQVREAVLAKDKERLSVLQAQTGRLQGVAQSFGALTIPERQAFANVSEKFAESKRRGGFGINALTPEEIALAQRGGAGRAIAAEQLEIARRDPAALRGARNFGIDEGAGAKGKLLGEAIDKGLNQSDELLSKLQKGEAEGQAKLAEGIVKAYADGTRSLIDEIIKQIGIQTSTIRAEIANKFRLKQAGR